MGTGGEGKTRLLHDFRRACLWLFGGRKTISREMCVKITMNTPERKNC